MFRRKTAETARGRRWGLRILLGAVMVIILSASGFVVWASPPPDSVMPQAYTALESDDLVTVTADGWIAFTPNDATPQTGFIFYQGARVRAEAYAPLARAIAEAGHLAVITYAPLNLAIFDTSMATPIIETYTGIENWVIGGHSLGGAAAAIYADANPEQIDALVLVASRPADDALADDDLDVMSIYGTLDGIATLDELETSIPNLPVDTDFVAIEGGNHSQFGYYGFQNGDGEAAISRDDQITQTAQAIIALLANIR